MLKRLAMATALLCVAAQDGAKGPIRVLVVSDSEPVAADLTRLLNSRGAMAEAGGIEAAALSRNDVAILHSGAFAALPADRKEALEAFAARGGGLVILNGAIAAGDASWWKPLAGGAWTAASRKFASRMMLYVAPHLHPIVRDAWSFDVDDDTVYDLDLSDRIQILGSAFTPKVTGRREAETRARADRANIYDLQPQLWAYEGDTHRAFVQLQGARHDSLRVFLLRAVAWTARREGLDALCTAEELASIRYPEGGPSRAADTVKKFQVHPEFTVTAVASEPLITKPIAVQWDARGRMWIAETPEYPNGRRPAVAPAWKETGTLESGRYDRPARDRISILIDTDGDGVFDKKEIFYEGLELVTGFCFYGDGVLAVHQPDIVWIRDTDGDGKADKVERILTGFAPGDSHFVANHLISGPDGWIYVSMGGVEEIRTPDKKISLGRATSGLFRFRPDGSALEQVSSKGGNGFGASLTSDFELFFGQATSGSPLQHVVLPEWTLAAGRLKTISGANSVINGRKVVVPKLPDRAPLMQIDVVGGYSAACGAMVYEGGAWPDAWTRGSFVTEPILNIIHHEVMQPAGATLAGDMIRPDAEFIRSNDYWFRPIDLAFGPDGAMYILDFYCPVIAHSDTRGPQHSRAGASVRPDRDHYFGRIYKVQHKESKAIAVPDLSKASEAELVAAFRHPNHVVRSNALRLLAGKKPAELEKAAADDSFPPARMLALWALHRAGAMTPALLKSALASPVAEVRKNAALIAEAGGAPSVAAELAVDLRDPDPRARIAVLRALAKTAWTESGAAALLAMFPELTDDWTRAAAVAAVDPAVALTAALKSEPAPALLPLLSAEAKRVAGRQDPAAFVPLLSAAAASRADAVKLVILEAAAALPSSPGPSEPLQNDLRTLLASENPRVSSAALPVAAAWGTSDAVRKDVATHVVESLAALENAATADDRRLELVTALAGARSASAEILPALGRLLTGASAPAVKRHTLAALGATGDAKAAPILLEALPKLEPSSQDAAISTLLSRSEWIQALLDAIESKSLPVAQLGPNNLFRLRTHPDKQVSARAVKLLDAIRKPSTNKDAAIAALLPEISKPGNVAAGREVFLKNCAACHQFNNLGNQVGPILTGMGAHGPDNLLVSIIDPNRAVDAGYEAWNVQTKSGAILSGILAQENDALMVLKTATGPVEIAKGDIQAAKKSSLSLMPEGLEALGAEALRDVLAFLCDGSSRYRVLDLNGAFTADTRRGLFHSAEQTGDTMLFRKYGLVQAEGIPFDLVDPARSVVGGNVIVLKGGGGQDFCQSFPDRVEVKVGVPVKAIHLLGGVAGWGATTPHEGPTILTLTLQYAGGAKEGVGLKDGVHFLDYPSNGDVPGSKRVEGVVRERQIRLITVPVEKSAVLEKIILSSPGRGPAAVTAAITVEPAR